MDDVSTKPALKRNPVRGDFQPFIADTRKKDKLMGKRKSKVRFTYFQMQCASTYSRGGTLNRQETIVRMQEDDLRGVSDLTKETHASTLARLMEITDEDYDRLNMRGFSVAYLHAVEEMLEMDVYF